MRRLVIILAILLAGCSKTAQPSRPAAAVKQFESTWRPAPDPEPKPPLAPIPLAPVPPPPPPPDPAAEMRRAEAARKQDLERRLRAREREFALLPSAEKRRISLTRDALAAKGIGLVSNTDLIVINLHPGQFPSVSPAELAHALAVYGDRKGAPEHLASLDIADPAIALQVRVAFGLTAEATCNAAKTVAAEISRVGLADASDRAKSFVARHPDLFPLPPAEDPAP